MGIRNLHIPLTGKFIPSPTKQIQFTDKTLALNRKQRRVMAKIEEMASAEA